MNKRFQKTHTNVKELAIVTSVDNFEKAREYEILLKNNEIPTIIKKRHVPDENGACEVVVMVPEKYLDEAHVVIESQNVYDDFYDFASDENEDLEFGSDIMDDDY